MRKTNSKSLIFLLLVLAAAAVVWFLVEQAKEGELIFQPAGKPIIESATIADFGTELEADLKSYDNDFSDLDKLQNDTSLDSLEKDLDILIK